MKPPSAAAPHLPPRAGKGPDLVPAGEGSLRKLFWRSFLIQAAWNYRGMQHLGLLWAQLPSLPADPALRGPALRRAGEFYNAHPYLCGCVLGAAARLEPEGQGEALARLKKAAIPPLGAVGDRLFWAGLKPLSGALGVLALAGLAARAPQPGAAWLPALAAALLATLLYNLVHLRWRWLALRVGHRQGLELAGALRVLAAHHGLARSGTALALTAGLALPLAAAFAWFTTMDLPAVELSALPALLFLAAAAASWQLPARGWALPLLLLALAALWLP
jgi:mannose/fructose/N-acetylgalactosamine-specific phosphotransferase system component IID